jgi:ABC-type multidrug transport system permease subunit
MSETKGRTWGAGLRIVLAIAAKDIGDAVANKVTLINLLSVVFVMVMWQVFPSFYKEEEANIIVYDQGQSQLTAEIDSDPRYGLLAAGSFPIFQELVREEGGGALGIVIPAGFDSQPEGQSQLDGYYPFAGRHKAAELKADLEGKFGAVIGRPVHIEVDGNVLYPGADTLGANQLIAMAFVIVPVFVSVATVPLLMIEEKRTRTVDVLQVSPATGVQLVMGKALAGLFYCLILSGVAIMLGRTMITQWALALGAILLGAVTLVGLGLLLGSVTDRPQLLSIWGFPLMAFLLFPVLLKAMEPILPEALAGALEWTPTVALATLFRISFSEWAEWGRVVTNVGIVLMWAIPLYAVLTRLVLRSDRR